MPAVDWPLCSLRVLVLAALKSSKVSRYHQPLTIHQSDAIQLAPLLHLRNDVRPKGTHHLKQDKESNLGKYSRQRSDSASPFSDRPLEMEVLRRPMQCPQSRNSHSCSILAPSATQPATRARAAYSGSLRPGPVNDRQVRPMPQSIYFPFLSLAQLSFLSFSVTFSLV